MSRHFISQCFCLSDTQKVAQTGPGGDAQQGGKAPALAETDPSEIRVYHRSCRAEPLATLLESLFSYVCILKWEWELDRVIDAKCSKTSVDFSGDRISKSKDSERGMGRQHWNSKTKLKNLNLKGLDIFLGSYLKSLWYGVFHRTQNHRKHLPSTSNVRRQQTTDSFWRHCPTGWGLRGWVNFNHRLGHDSKRIAQRANTGGKCSAGDGRNGKALFIHSFPPRFHKYLLC